MSIFERIEKHIWLMVLPVAFWVYAASFDSIPALEKDHSILGESDAAAFIVLISDFSLSRTYGDPYRLQGRRLEDVAQKHKIHHILYVVVAAILYKVFSVLYVLLGLPSEQAFYAINAALGCVNICLLYQLLKKIDVGKKYKAVFVVLYAFSLSSWIFHSVPESWPFSATLVLLFLVLHFNLRINSVALAVYIGIAMLNNIFLGTLCFFLIIHHWLMTRSLIPFILKSMGTIAMAVVVWLVAMTLLSVFDPHFRPDHYFEYTRWFKSHIAPPVVISDTYYWKSALSQLYITSILSNQSAPNVPQESLLYTIQQSWLGLGATVIYLCLLLTLGIRGSKHIVSELKRRGGFNALLSTVYLPMALYAVAWLFLTIIMDTGGAFLYSTMVTPMIVAALYRFTDWQRWMHRILWTAALCAVLVNNAQQISSFRMALLAMTP